MDNYLEKVAIPFLNRAGSTPIGVFTQQERSGAAGSTEIRDASTVLVLIPYPSAEAFAKTTAAFNAQIEGQKGGEEYLQAGKDKPAFERIDSWLMLAFAGMPKVELPAYSKERKPRMFEIRTYESHSEIKALKKEIRQMVDRILYGVGVGSSFRKGKWFFGEIEQFFRYINSFF